MVGEPEDKVRDEAASKLMAYIDGGDIVRTVWGVHGFMVVRCDPPPSATLSILRPAQSQTVPAQRNVWRGEREVPYTSYLM